VSAHFLSCTARHHLTPKGMKVHPGSSKTTNACVFVCVCGGVLQDGGLTAGEAGPPVPLPPYMLGRSACQELPQLLSCHPTC
jgi:hypothetical protein